VTELEIENELQTLRMQLATLQDEHIKTRKGWLRSMRSTGGLLGVFAIAIFLGVLQSHGSAQSNPVAISFLVIGLFMLAVALWLFVTSTQWVAEKLMQAAVR